MEWGEYYMEPTPEDHRQNHRLQELENAIKSINESLIGVWRNLQELEGADRALEIALVGHNGQNGVRGTMMAHYEQVHKRMDNLEASVNHMSVSIAAFAVQLESLTVTLKMGIKIAAAIGSIIAAAGTVVAILVSLGVIG